MEKNGKKKKKKGKKETYSSLQAGEIWQWSSCLSSQAGVALIRAASERRLPSTVSTFSLFSRAVIRIPITGIGVAESEAQQASRSISYKV